MKTTLKKGLWKAIVFLTLVISCIACEGCEEPLLSPQIVSSTFKLDTPCVLRVKIIPNEETEVIFRFKEDGMSDFVSKAYQEKIFGSNPVEVVFDLPEFQDKKIYQYEIIASSNAGIAKETNRVITGMWKAKISLSDPEMVRMTSAKLVAWVTPYFNDTKVSFEYSEDKINWKKQTLPTKISGSDSVKMTFNLLDLKVNTEYSFRVTTLNSVGKTESDIKTFLTCAVSDYDDNHYHIVAINGQIWLKENFKGTHYANGDPIEDYCFYNNDPKNGEIYGGLYSWHVANDPRGLIIGFETPDEKDWENLLSYIADTYQSGSRTNIARLLMSKEYWTGNLFGTDVVGFSILPAGIFTDKRFFYLGEDASFWLTGESGEDGLCVYITNSLGYYLRSNLPAEKNFLMSIRLIKKEGT